MPKWADVYILQETIKCIYLEFLTHLLFDRFVTKEWTKCLANNRIQMKIIYSIVWRLLCYQFSWWAKQFGLTAGIPFP
jgi:hypothetical protein